MSLWSTIRAATPRPRVARDAAAALGAGGRLTVLFGTRFAGRMDRQIVGAAAGRRTCRERGRGRRTIILLTDADIVYAPDALHALAARANADGLVLTSLMAKLRCKSFAERMFVPAFIFFFQMLYPFAWANDPRGATAAAAGGCMLVRRERLRAAGGLAAIRDALIDDCALAKLLKSHGPISITLTDRVHSIRAYPAVGDIRRMVSRTAYAQLRYSPLLLAGNRARSRADLSGAGGAGAVRDRRRAIHRHFRLAFDGVGISPDARILPVVDFMGSGVAVNRRHVYGVHA